MAELLVAALRHPASVSELSLAQWELLLRQARSADLLGRLAEQVHAGGALQQVPTAPRRHLEAARHVMAAQREDVWREVDQVRATLAPIGVPMVLLKGAAYLASGVAAAVGRAMSDIDILVPRDRLSEVEAALMLQGWVTTHHSAYDQRYYRRWMHELPPMRHLQRHTVLDVHHTILPLTARLQPDPGLLWAASRALEGEWAGVRVLSLEDMVLHSMTHLFHNEEWTHGLRDLSDLDLLLRNPPDAAFWSRLPARAEQLGLGRPLYHGLRCTSRLLGTPVPAEVLTAVERHAPPAPVRQLMDSLWSRVLATPHASARPAWARASAFLLYLRAHWLKMPPSLLIPHLLVKAMRLHEREPDASDVAPHRGA